MQQENWIAFCSIALIATASPGPAALLVSTHSVAFGFRRSLATVAGNVTGLLVMSALSVLGLTALVLQSSIAFAVVKTIGALYLMFLGVKLWKNGLGLAEQESPRGGKASIWRLYFQGVLVALTNPKAILFTTALFPQFVVISEPLLPQFGLLVLSFMSLSAVCLASYAKLAQKARGEVRQFAPTKLLGRLFGSTLFGAGLMMAFARR